MDAEAALMENAHIISEYWDTAWCTCNRGETRALIGGGGEYSYIRALPDEFLLKLTLMTADLKRNSSGRTRYEYLPPPPPN